MKYEIKHNNGEVLFVAEIDCKEDEKYGVKTGLSVIWAINNKSDLQGASLQWVDLQGADLRGADFRGTDFQSADLRGADLRESNLQGADLRWVDLRESNLQGSNLQDADFQSADLRGVNLRGSDLVILQLPYFTAYIQKTHTRIGCKYFKNSEWLAFTNAEIAEFDKNALYFCTKYKPLIESAMNSLNKDALV